MNKFEEHLLKAEHSQHFIQNIPAMEALGLFEVKF